MAKDVNHVRRVDNIIAKTMEKYIGFTVYFR